ncbi:MAG: SIR2 family protein [Clostridiaceae bacterium]|nr:SIR2 family protein [Clostridiaceae bacterium]
MSEIERTFDPSECIRGIQQLLVSDKKKIAFLFGAGTSLAKKEDGSPSVPAIGKMTELVEEDLRNDPDKGALFASAIDEIQEELSQQSLSFNVETLLSNVEEKIRIICGGTLNGLDKAALEEMDAKIRAKIQGIVSVHKSIEIGKEDLLIHHDFAKWICNADRKYAVEIFTTNYDYLFEIGLEAVGIPYYDGFTGSYKPFFNPDSLEDINYLPQQTKLWKIHGSLGLHEEAIADSKKIIRMNSDTNDLLIYPSSLKYSNSKKQPYVAFMDRLNVFLKQDDAVLFVCGYSFGDDHINERILSALSTNSTSHVFVMFYDIVWEKDHTGKDVKENTFCLDSELAKIALKNRKISVLSTRSAVIGGQYSTWKLKREPDKEDSLNVSWYYDEDAPENSEAELGQEHKGGEAWTGMGELTLPDFSWFTRFLKNMIPKNEWE